MAAKIDLIGKRFGSLTVLGTAAKTSVKRRWVCQCTCGAITYPQTSDLTAGKSTACRGCGTKKHGHTNFGAPPSPTYRSWQAMRDRCSNPRATSYHRYGGRGISVCDRWSSFDNFLEDMGERPSLAYSIDRIDGDGNYTPENCQWATQFEQTRPWKRLANPTSTVGRKRDAATGRWAKN